MVTLAAPGETELADLVELYEGIAEAGVPVVGGDTTRADSLLLSVTALGERTDPPRRAGAASRRPPRRHPDRSARPAPLSRRHVRPAAAPSRRRASAGGSRERDARHLRRRGEDAGHLARRSGCRIVIELDRVPLAPDAELADLGFGEDYELLAAVRRADGFPVVGRCEQGAGVVVTWEGEPVELAGWDHFSSR